MLGKWIARRREDEDLSQAELADRLGWSVETLRRVERGKRGFRNQGEIIAIARELDLPEEKVRDVADGGDYYFDRIGTPESFAVQRKQVELLIAKSEQWTAEMRELLDAIDAQARFMAELDEQIRKEEEAGGDPSRGHPEDSEDLADAIEEARRAGEQRPQPDQEQDDERRRAG